MSPGTLSQRALNRALLARQLLVAGAWSVRNGRIELDPYEPLSARDQRAVDREREALESFHA
jgi:hypothetical protein